MQRSGLAHVWLDIRHLGEEAIRHHFPTIHAHCAARGLDLAREPIPVVPAAHYSCGGVGTDLAGATTVPHLYAIGEVACTGLHGANRMASNSLLECLAFARGCARRLAEGSTASTAPLVERSWGTQRPSREQIGELRDAMRGVMSTRVAIVRSDAGLDEAAHALAEIHERLAPHLAEAAPDAEPPASGMPFASHG